MLKTYHFMIIYALQCIYIYYIWIVEILYSGVLLYFFSPTLSSLTSYW